jgi:hypothetical protein
MLMSAVMPVDDQKRKEDSAMTPQCSQKAWKAEHRWLSILLLCILAAVILIATIASAKPATAAECLVTKADATSQSLTTSEGTTSWTLPLTITVDRDLYRGLVPSPVRKSAPYMNRSRMSLSGTEDQEITTIGACLSQDIRESALFKHAMMTSHGKAKANAHTQVMKFSALPYDGKRHIFIVRTTPPEIGISVRKKARTIIGPVPELQQSILPDAQSVSQPVATGPSTVEFPSPFGGQLLVAVHPFQNALELPSKESLRMNLTTVQAVPDGNCAGGCP